MEEFMKEPFDFKRFAILNLKRIWIVILTAIVCACLFGVVYTCYRNSQQTVYRSDILYNISFDRDQVNNIHDYYNDYTWNDVLDSDAIAGKAAGYIGVSKADIADSTTIPTMSDIRLIHVYVDTDSMELSEKYADAITDALSAFAGETDGFKSIEVMSNEGVSTVDIADYILRCTVAGGIIGLILGIIIVLYISAMDDRIYIEKDVRKVVGDMAIIAVSNGNVLTKNADTYGIADAKVIPLDLDIASSEEITELSKMLSCGGTSDKDIVISVKAGKDSSLVLYREYENYKAAGKNVVAVLLNYDKSDFYRKYYK